MLQWKANCREMFEDRLSILIVHFATSSSPLIKLRHKITKQRAVSARVAANNADSRATRLLLHFLPSTMQRHVNLFLLNLIWRWLCMLSSCDYEIRMPREKSRSATEIYSLMHDSGNSIVRRCNVRKALEIVALYIISLLRCASASRKVFSTRAMSKQQNKCANECDAVFVHSILFSSDEGREWRMH